MLGYIIFHYIVVYYLFGRRDDEVGNPHRGQMPKFEFFELFLLFKLGSKLYIERFEATVSQSTVSSPLFNIKVK